VVELLWLLELYSTKEREGFFGFRAKVSSEMRVARLKTRSFDG